MATAGLGQGEASSAANAPDISYANIMASSRYEGIQFEDLPGFTRSVYARNYALVTPESHVWAGNPAWRNALTAHVISPVVSAKFSMLLVNMKADSSAGAPEEGIERFALVLDGQVTVEAAGDSPVTLHANDFFYLPAGQAQSINSTKGAGLLVFERKYALQAGEPRFVHGNTEEQPVLPVDGEVFVLRKLLPQTAHYDFNVHVMDFKPGEYLNVKEVHYNQHGLLLLKGKGIYRLGNDWYPVQAGDCIWMGPYVPQWYAALGTSDSRYIIFKDTILDPIHA
ncbi:hypothetical protein N2152v2_009155 [Parachlorella kessleri]